MKTFYNQFTEYKHTKEELLSLAQTCENRKDFDKKGYTRCAKRQNILQECQKILDENKRQKATDKENQTIHSIEQNLPKYKSIVEFRKHHPKLYYYIRAKNIEKYLNYYIRQKYSTQQMICKIILEKLLNEKCMYNTRKILEGKELDIFFSKWNLACEYNGYYWHKGSKEKDEHKKEICKQKNIILCTINESKSNDHQNIEYAILDIKKQFIGQLPTLIHATNLSLMESHINDIIINKEDLFVGMFAQKDIDYIINTCSRYSEVKNKYNKIWQYLLRNKMLHVLSPIKTRDYIHMNKEQFISFVVNTFSSYTYFTKHKCYEIGRKKKYLYDIKQKFIEKNTSQLNV